MRESDFVRVCSTFGRDFLEGYDEVQKIFLVEELGLLSLRTSPLEERFDGFLRRFPTNSGRGSNRIRRSHEGQTEVRGVLGEDENLGFYEGKLGLYIFYWAFGPWALVLG